jgi:hypothetical protein
MNDKMVKEKILNELKELEKMYSSTLVWEIKTKIKSSVHYIRECFANAASVSPMPIPVAELTLKAEPTIVDDDDVIDVTDIKKEPSQPGTSAELIRPEKETIGFECDECGKIYAGEEELKEHKKKRCEGNTAILNDIGRIMNESIVKSTKHANYYRYECIFCKKSFDGQRAQLKKHLKSVHSNDVASHQISKPTNSIESRPASTSTESEKKKNSSLTNNSRKAREKPTTDEIPPNSKIQKISKNKSKNEFVCYRPDCKDPNGRRFSTQSLLDRHLKGHHTDKKFKCRICTYQNDSKNVLNLHMENKHFTFKCTNVHCNRRFETNLLLQQHKQSRPLFCGSV